MIENKDKKGLEVFDSDEWHLPAEAAGGDLARVKVPQFVEMPVSPLLTYFILPVIFLLVTLLGGIRLSAEDNAFLFLRPELICLVFGAITILLYFRAGLISVEGWVSGTVPSIQNVANVLILLTLSSATVQIFNSLLPEKGAALWIIGFCFLWTLWTYLFAEFNSKRLIKSVTAMLALAFVVKYLVLANLTAPADGGWLHRLVENPGRETFTWLLDLPRYSPGTGYIQFFSLILYLAGLYITPRSTHQ